MIRKISITMAIAFYLTYAMWLPSHAMAGSGDEGRAGAVFLKLDPDAQSTGYGSSYIARATDGHATHFNPSGLARLKFLEMKFTQFDMIADISYNHLTLTAPITKNWGGVGLRATTLDYGNLRRTTINTTTDNPQTGQGNFGADDIALSGSYGIKLTSYLDAGVTLKHIRQSIADFNATAQAVDVGIKIHPPFKFLKFGFAARNLGGELKFIQETDPLPQVYEGGMNLSLPVRNGADRLHFGADFVVPGDAPAYGTAGLEYDIEQILALRAGYNGASDVGNNLTFGGGVHIKDKFSVDYSFSSLDQLGDNHRFSVSYKFGPVHEEFQSKPEEPDSIRPEMREEKDLYRNLIRPPLEPKAMRDKFLKPENLYEWKNAYELGKQAYLDGEYNNARKQFNKVKKVKPNFVKNLIWLGIVEHNLGLDEKAKERFYRALEIEPENDLARRNLERLLE